MIRSTRFSRQLLRLRGAFVVADPSLLVLTASNQSHAASFPTATIQLPATTTTQLIQTRFFAANKRNKKGGRGGGGNGNKFKVYVAFEDHIENVEDVFEDDEPEFFDSTGDLQQFVKSFTEKFFLDETELKIYNSKSKSFEALTSIQQVQEEHNKSGHVLILPEFPYDSDVDYDDEEEEEEEDDDDDDDDEFERLYGDGASNESLSAILHDVAGRTRSAGWTPVKEDASLTLENSSGERVATKKVILDLANTDEVLQKVLVNRIGALDHIAMGLHFDFVWNNLDDTLEAEYKEKD
eukprot:scaffold1068_cov167-Amphora_coffeaeformis.AAC.17